MVYTDNNGAVYRITQRQVQTVVDNSVTTFNILNPVTLLYPPSLGIARCQLIQFRLSILDSTMFGNIWESSIPVTLTSSAVVDTTLSELQWTARMTEWSRNVPNTVYGSTPNCNYFLTQADLLAGQLRAYINGTGSLGNFVITLETEVFMYNA